MFWDTRNLLQLLSHIYNMINLNVILQFCKLIFQVIVSTTKSVIYFYVYLCVFIIVGQHMTYTIYISLIIVVVVILVVVFISFT